MAKFKTRANIKFLTRLNGKSVKIIEALRQVYGESAPCREVVYDWIKLFKEIREQLEDNSREGDPPSHKIKKSSGLCRIKFKKIEK